MDNTARFCEIVRLRSNEHKQAIELLSHKGLTGQVVSILRQELDSMVRVIYLLNHPLDERSRLINLTMAGENWKQKNKARITDRQMVELADALTGWTKSVYQFGCAFIHLSSFHDYTFSDPFKNLPPEEVAAIKAHLNSYHGLTLTSDLTIHTITPYLPMVFDKIQGNLECYVQHLEKHELNIV